MAKILRVDPAHPESAFIREAASVIRKGELVAFPTETVYGLGADATSASAVSRIFQAKGRPGDNPLIVHIAEMAELSGLAADIPPHALVLAERFWPGPLTMVMKDAGEVASAVTAGLGTVAVRMPDCPIAVSLIKEAGVPLAAPSANISGRPSPTRAEDVEKDLGEKIPLILDGGPAKGGLESTVISLVTGSAPEILRPGIIGQRQLEKVLGLKVSLATGQGRVLAPGMKYRHYSPNADVFVVGGKGRIEGLKRLAGDFFKKGKKVSLLVFDDSLDELKGLPARSLSSRDDLHGYGSKLYSTLREMDEEGIEVILAEEVPNEGIGAAIADRLSKAAKGFYRF